VSKVEEGNNLLLAASRNKIKETVNRLKENIDKEAVSIKAKEDIEQSKNNLDAIATRVAMEWSIANINRLEEEAKLVFEKEINRLAKKIVSEPNKPKVKEIQTIRVREEVQKPYLETESDVNEFIGDLNKKLKIAIKEGKRIRVE
jgi:hypothetical protein